MYYVITDNMFLGEIFMMSDSTQIVNVRNAITNEITTATYRDLLLLANSETLIGGKLHYRNGKIFGVSVVPCTLTGSYLMELVESDNNKLGYKVKKSVVTTKVQAPIPIGISDGYVMTVNMQGSTVKMLIGDYILMCYTKIGVDDIHKYIKMATDSKGVAHLYVYTGAENAFRDNLAVRSWTILRYYKFKVKSMQTLVKLLSDFAQQSFKNSIIR